MLQLPVRDTLSKFGWKDYTNQANTIQIQCIWLWKLLMWANCSKTWFNQPAANQKNKQVINSWLLWPHMTNDHSKQHGDIQTITERIKG